VGGQTNQMRAAPAVYVHAIYIYLQLSLWLVGICAILRKASSFSWQHVPRNCASKDCYEWRVCFICLGLSRVDLYLANFVII